jgi:F0F1-type ATP synthase membrane subunit c/vacuolar-type H+-ATPase subunit K
MKTLIDKAPSFLYLVAALAMALPMAGAGVASAGGIDVYLSAPASQSSLYSNITTETFSSFSTGIYTSPLASPLGSYQLTSTTKLAVLADDQYGTGTGNYVSLGAQSGSSLPVTLQLARSVSYFGFSWNAGDTNNQLAFYDSGRLVGNYSTTSIFAVLKNMSVAPLLGPSYLSSDYYGKPNSGSSRANSGEPYAFINFISNGGTFNSVVFSNSNTVGTGFESDNHTIRTDAPTPDNSFVRVGSTFVPEPGNVAFCFGLVMVGSMFTLRRRMGRARG